MHHKSAGSGYVYMVVHSGLVLELIRGLSSYVAPNDYFKVRKDSKSGKLIFRCSMTQAHYLSRVGKRNHPITAAR